MSDSDHPENMKPACLKDRGDRDWPRRRLLVTLAVVLPVIFLVLMTGILAQLGADQPANRGQATIAARLALAKAADQAAASFSLVGLQGTRSISLNEFAGRVVVLNFWASWCAPCKEEAPQLQAVWQAYRDEGVQFLGVDHRDYRSAAETFQRQFGITYPSVFDPGGGLSAEYGLAGIPSTFVIDGNGRIAYRFLGRIDAPLLRAALNAVLSVERG